MRRLLTVTLVALAACSSTIRLKPQMDEHVEAFLGEAYPLLEPGKEGEADLRYVNHDVDWKKYRGVLLEPVQFWAGADSKISPEGQTILTSYLYNSLKENLAKVGSNLVDLPGPGILRAQLAVMDVSKSTPVLRTISLVIPQARLINQAQQLVTGSYGFAGSAEVALKVTDSQTGQLLAAAVDRRAGGGAISQAAVWQWGDLQAVIDAWSQQFAQRMAELRERAKGASTATH